MQRAIPGLQGNGLGDSCQRNARLCDPGSGGPGINHNFRDLFLFVPPNFVEFRSAVKTYAMGDDVAGIDLAFLDSLEKGFM
jgi:hypothetical protein